LKSSTLNAGPVVPTKRAGAAGVHDVADLGADDGELVVVIAIDFAREGELVLEDHQRFVGDHRDGEKGVRHCPLLEGKLR
jgi:hypothetical protein